MRRTMRASRRSLERDAGAARRSCRGTGSCSVEPCTRTCRVAQRGQAEGVVLARVLLVADAHARGLEQAHHGGEHLVARQARQREVGCTRRRMRGSARAKASMRPYLVSSRTSRQRAVVAVLLAAARVAPGGLQVAVVARADPDVSHAGGMASERMRASVAASRTAAAVGPHVAEALAGAPARDPRRGVAHVAQPGGPGGALGCKRCKSFRFGGVHRPGALPANGVPARYHSALDEAASPGRRAAAAPGRQDRPAGGPLSHAVRAQPAADVGGRRRRRCVSSRSTTPRCASTGTRATSSSP